MRCELFLENIATINFQMKIADGTPIHPDLDETIFFNSIDSTNLEARRRRSDFKHRNVLFVSNKQTAGLGQHGREWDSPADLGLWMSLFLARPETLAHNFTLLSLYTGVILHRTVGQFLQADIRLKWPNDIMIGPRKCGGVLTEIQWQGNKLLSTIIGIGINFSHKASDFPPGLRDSATSLQLAGWQEPDRDKFLHVFIEDFFQQLDLLDTSQALMTTWNSLAYKLNETVRWISNDAIMDGQFLGINQSGEALIRIGDEIRKFQSGEIRQLSPI